MLWAGCGEVDNKTRGLINVLFADICLKTRPNGSNGGPVCVRLGVCLCVRSLGGQCSRSGLEWPAETGQWSESFVETGEVC